MKVAVIYQYIYPQNFGGGEKRLFEVFSRFPDNSKIDWYVQYHADYLSYQELSRFNIINFENRTKPDERRSILEIVRYCYYLLTKLDLTKYDVVHIGQMPFFHILPILIKSKFYKIFTRSSAVISIDWWEFWGKYWFVKHGKIVGTVGYLLEKMIMKLSTNLIVISPKTKNDIFQKTQANIVLIHNGVDLKRIAAAKAGDRKYDIAIFGRIEEWKNPMMGVQVFQNMLKKNADLKMIIIGDGSYKATLQAYIDAHCLGSNIHFHGRAEEGEVYSLLKSSKMMFLFSKQEGGGSITLFEANACGLPVATAFFENGIDEELVTKMNGFFFKNESYEQISKIIYENLISNDYLQELSSTCVEFVKKYDWESISEQYHNYFEKMLKETP